MRILPFTSRRAFASSFALLGVSLTLGCSILAGCGASPAEAVNAWTPFKATDSSFAGDGPTGWDVSKGDRGSTDAQVIYTKGNATISTVSDAASSFAADGILRSNTKPPVETLHEKSLASLGKKLGTLEPQPMQTMTSTLGPARYCEFTANNGGTHGYHVTILGSERAIYVNAYCPESDWATLKPAFSNFISKLKPATG